MTPDGVTETVRDDCMAFLTRHARHPLETLRPVQGKSFHTGALWDSTAPTYWEVSNGERTAVVEGLRARVGGPMSYRLRMGRLVAEHVAVEVPAGELRELVDRALYPGVAPERKLAAFAESFKRLVWSLDPATFAILYDVPGDPSLAVAKLPTHALAELAARTRSIFDARETAAILARIAGGEDDPDGLTVLVRQRVRIEG
jgi:hypothetical protein